MIGVALPEANSQENSAQLTSEDAVAMLENVNDESSQSSEEDADDSDYISTPGAPTDEDFGDHHSDSKNSRKRQLPPLKFDGPKAKRLRPDGGHVAQSHHESAQSPAAKAPSQRRIKKQKRLEKEQAELAISKSTGIEDYLATHNADGTKKRRSTKRTKVVAAQKAGQASGDYASLGRLIGGHVLDDAHAANSLEAQQPIIEHDRIAALQKMVQNVSRANKKQAREDKKDLKLALDNLGKKNSKHVIEESTNKWGFAGMSTSLFHHQVIGAAFMKSRENGKYAPFGGIMADAMGLGKTVMAVCLMIAIPPPRSERRKCTLIVCPENLVDQWMKEVKRHAAKGKFKRPLNYYATGDLRGWSFEKQLEEADVVIASHSQVQRSYPKLEIPGEAPDLNEVKEKWERAWEDRGPLHKAFFHRVILDESQYIKNHKTQLSLACRALMAKHHWALSGTPIMNGVDELFPYFKFLRVPGVSTCEDFKNTYSIQGNADCFQRLQHLLSEILIRRCHKDEMFGAALVKLPKHDFSPTELAFSPVEKAVSYLLTKYTVDQINKTAGDLTIYRTAGDGELDFQPEIKFIVRMRQMTSHISRAQECFMEFLKPYHLEAIEDSLTGQRSQPARLDRDLIAALGRFVDAKMIEIKQEVKLDGFEEETAARPLSKLNARFSRLLADIKRNKDYREWSKRIVCSDCGEPPEEAQVTSCLHVYCAACLVDLASRAAEEEFNHVCKACNQVFETFEHCQDLDQLETKHLIQAQKQPAEKFGYRDRLLDISWVKYNGKLILSTKIRAARRQITLWLDENPEDKIIVFSQWQMSMSVLEEVAQLEGWGYVTINGKVDVKRRSMIIEHIQKDPKEQLMISSWKCGGTGLNLTMANRILNMDLWFNQSAEDQAYCRVFRIGQKKQTYISRLFIGQSIDVRLDEMQKCKEEQISQAIDLQSLVDSLSNEERLEIFGSVRRKNNRLFVEMDEDEELERFFRKHALKHGKVHE